MEFTGAGGLYTSLKVVTTKLSVLAMLPSSRVHVLLCECVCGGGGGGVMAGRRSMCVCVCVCVWMVYV